ncbi:MAG: sulfotransferase domain-containing protein [Bacteroidia bacterium]|jgi:hypothetical protein|nr:sulfotransferase domain-containing protein [Bacteroidia bacterium]
MPHTPRQYLRALLLKLGIGSEASYRLNLHEIRSNDIFLCSYPKSGNTWLRFILAYLISNRIDITPRNIDEIVPDVYMAVDKANALPSPRILKTHHALLGDYPKTIYIVRDVRDVMLSYYHYQIALGAFKGSFTSFIDAADTLHPFGTWSEHVARALEFAQKHPERILLLRYEDLIEQPETEVKKLAAFIGSKLSHSITEAISLSEFGRLKELEAQHGSSFSDKSGKQFFRSGKSGQALSELSSNDNQLLLTRHHEMMKALRYL